MGNPSDVDVNKSCLMVIALYNAAVELEHLGSLPDAVEYYQEALQVSPSLAFAFCGCRAFDKADALCVAWSSLVKPCPCLLDLFLDFPQVATSELGSEHALVESVSSALAVARRSAVKASKRPIAPYDESLETASVLSDLDGPVGRAEDGRGLPGLAPRTPLSTVSDSNRQMGKRPQGSRPGESSVRLPGVGSPSSPGSGPVANATWSPATGLAASGSLPAGAGGLAPSPPSHPRLGQGSSRPGSFRGERDLG
jgi:hypothetical protein